MNELKKEIERPEIFNAIRDSIGDARYAAKKLAELFTDTIQPLRLEESEHVFVNLTQNIQELDCFIDFIATLKEGMGYYENFGLMADPLLSHNAGIDIFREMHSALESKDWIMLADIIEYELSPLLIREDEWLGALNEKIVKVDAHTTHTL